MTDRGNKRGRSPDDVTGELKRKAEELKRTRDYREQLVRDRTTLLKDPSYLRVLSDMVARGGVLMSSVMADSERTTEYLSGRQDLAREFFLDHYAIDKDAALALFKPKHGNE